LQKDNYDEINRNIERAIQPKKKVGESPPIQYTDNLDDIFGGPDDAGEGEDWDGGYTDPEPSGGYEP